MKKIITLSILIFALLPPPVFAANMKIINIIPGRYALAQITGAEPVGAALDKGGILKAVKEQMELNKVEIIQFAIYEGDHKPGGGVIRAFGEMTTREVDNINEFVDFLLSDDAAEEEKQKNIEAMGMVEKVFGYQCEPKELFDAYHDNEVVADDDFKGKTVILEVEVPKVAKDAFDKPYIPVPVDKHGFSGVRLRLDRNDPFLRSIKRGSNIIVSGEPAGMLMGDVIIDARIIMVKPEQPKQQKKGKKK